MTERLRGNPNELEALIGVTAEAYEISRDYIEKDFWVTEVLRSASTDQIITLPDGTTATVTFTFKGGTSLSRVFGIIERFSEDVDLLAIFPTEASMNARHKVLKAVDANVKQHLELQDSQVTINTSTTGIKRYTTYRYPTNSHDPSLKEGVLLELGSRGGTRPLTIHEYRGLCDFYTR